MNKLFTFLSRYNRREQTALLLCGLAITLYLIWAAVLNPLANKRAAQLQANTAATQSLGRVQILAARFEQARNQNATAGNVGGGNISQIVYSSLQANGINISQFQPGTAGEARVRLDRANYEALMQWLYDIEFKHQIIVRELSLAGTNDPGQVTVNIRLQKH
jgi:general secretion pathway protein M